MKKILQIILFFIFSFLTILCPGNGFSLEQTGKQAGKDAGRLFNNNYKSDGNIDNRLNMPLTQITPLSTLDNSKSGSATTFCGTGDVQNEKIALQVRVYQSGSYYYINTYSDTNGDGILDSSRSFIVTQVCLGGYKYGSAYYKWTVWSSGYVSTTTSTLLDGCMDPLVNPPTYCGGALSQTYAEATGKSITNSSFSSDTATYYVGQVKDCNNNTKDITATKYYGNPYKMNDGAIATVATCNPNDPMCQAYQGTQSASSNVSTSTAGTVTCTVTRNIINAQGPQNGIICNSNTIYYANSYANGICYKTAGSTWDYNAGFKARCDSFGKNLTLEGWASWEGAPCGQNANWPPQPQITYALDYGGNASSAQIGTLSTNRRMCGSNCAYNDQGGDTRCITDVTPVRVNLSRSCNTNNVTCNYNISVVNAPACPSYVVSVSAPVGENIDNQCATYEEQNCNLVNEWWYTSTGTSVQTVKNGVLTNTYPASTCRTFSALGSVCKDWWTKTRTYSCGGTNKFSPDISRAATVMDSADNAGTSTVTYARSAFNKEHTSNCIKQIDYEYPFTTQAACTSLGGVVRCPPGFTMSGNVCVGSPVCPADSNFNGTSDHCELDVVPQCLEAGFVYNSATRMCQQDPTCPVGMFNSGTDRCEITPVPNCDSGFTYNSAAQMCEASGYCEEGNYNSSIHLCQAAPVPDSCNPQDYTYNSISGFCEGNPDCTKGTFSTTSYMCELDPVFCQNGFTFDNPAWLCHKPPVCTKGVYDGSIDKCETEPRFCPSNFEYNSADFICRADLSCTPGIFNPSTDQCTSDPKCEKTENKEFACVYDNPANQTGLRCDDSSFAIQQYEVRRETLRDCIENAQCSITCVVSVPDGSGGYNSEQRACTDNGNDTYTCPSGTYSIVRQCGCIINAFDGSEVKESDCTVSCMVVSPNSNPGGNVTNDYIIKECTQTIVNNSPSYTCPLIGSEYVYQGCGCIDTFGLSAGVMGALVEAIRDKECIP